VKISEKRKTAIYAAVANAITDLRIKYQMRQRKALTVDEVDGDLFTLEQKAGEAAIRAATGPENS
jgi:hypothetical protein